jgi:hypothetical protein
MGQQENEGHAQESNGESAGQGAGQGAEDNAEYWGYLPPHPLICGLAVGGEFENLEAATQAAAYWVSPIPSAAQRPNWSDDWTEAVEAFPRPDRMRVVLFAGYLGPQQTDPHPDHGSNRTWRLLYQDAKATSWLMVPEAAIVLFNRCEDHRAAFRLRDYIWVRADAPVRQGIEDESELARFLVGTFTCAGDLHDELRDASTASAGSGILCAPTPECCHRGTGP